MDLDTNSEKIDEMPFNSDRKMMSVVVRIDNKLYSLIKGAPDILLNNASHGLDDNQIKPISEVKNKILEKNEEFAKNALRVLGIAYKPLNEGYKEEEIEQEYIYLGLAGIIDPARDEVKDAIEEARMAGIRTIMITGDHKITAIAIAHEIGLTESTDAITGMDLEDMNDDVLREKVKTVDIFARVTSEHKLRILRRLKELDLVVSMYERQLSLGRAFLYARDYVKAFARILGEKIWTGFKISNGNNCHHWCIVCAYWNEFVCRSCCF